MTASDAGMKTKTRKKAKGGVDGGGGDGSEWVAGQKPHPVRLSLSRPPGPRDGGGTAGRKRFNRGKRTKRCKTNARTRQSPRHPRATTTR